VEQIQLNRRRAAIGKWTDYKQDKGERHQRRRIRQLGGKRKERKTKSKEWEKGMQRKERAGKEEDE
jgi:hypothetical protein